MDALTENELAELDEFGEEEKQSFRITDIDSLNWALRKLKALKAKQDENDQLAKNEFERIEKWLAKQNEKIDSKIDYFESIIKIYHMDVLNEDAKAKTISTPYGRIKSRTTKPKVKVTDDETLLNFLKESSSKFIKTVETEKVDWTNLKEKIEIATVGNQLIPIDENGQVVEGVTIEPEQTTFKIEV